MDADDLEAELRWVASMTRAGSVAGTSRIQSVWGGYGSIYRVHLERAELATAVVKSVKPPRGKETAETGGISHSRKCRSYDVEAAWYESFAPRCEGACRTAKLLGSRVTGERWLFLLEDLDAAGFALRRRRLEEERIDACLAWLADLHAYFFEERPTRLWQQGSYWHLSTRLEELSRTENRALREAAPILDALLDACPFKTIIHGDAKVANFCFAEDATAPVAAVDFQYAGGGWE